MNVNYAWWMDGWMDGCLMSRLRQLEHIDMILIWPLFLLTPLAELNFKDLSSQGNRVQKDMSTYPDKLFWLRAKLRLLNLMSCVRQRCSKYQFLILWNDPASDLNPWPSSFEVSTLPQTLNKAEICLVELEPKSFLIIS